MVNLGKLKIIFIVFGVFIFFLMVVVIDESSKVDRIKGNGVACFKECSMLCISKDSKITSFATVSNRCSCTCLNDKQYNFELK